jgi:hypothetical protein
MGKEVQRVKLGADRKGSFGGIDAAKLADRRRDTHTLTV